MDNSYKVGSVWRKWDMHVHSPFSMTFSGSWDQFVNQVKNADCDVVGINDYFSVAGYKKFIEEIAAGNVEVGDRVLFPVVEMRMTDTVQNKHNKTHGATHFNFHLIFNNDSQQLSVDDIETFIKSLESNNTMIGSDYDDKNKLMGKKVSFRDVLKKLESDTKFKDNFLVWLPYDEYGGIDDIDPNSDGWIKENFIKDSHILGSSRQEQIDFFHWKSPLKPDGEPKFSQEEFAKWFEAKKPSIKGSDSHQADYSIGRLRNENSAPVERYCWIKADPTFLGLQQIVHEPEDRVYIGEIPSSLVRVNQNPTKVMRSVSVCKNDQCKTDEKWFDFDLPLNDGLVAIIGNKGSGKSALSDIIGLLGNTRRYEKFSFLTREKFCSTKRGKAKYFKGEITWVDNKTDPLDTLEANFNPSMQERVKYIPQSYLEDICSEVGFSEEGPFYRELKEVIFSRIGESDRLGFDNLDSLLRHRDKEIENRIDQLISEAKALNREIVEVEEKLSAEHALELQANLDAKNNELLAHESDEVKPKSVPKPDDVNQSGDTKTEQKYLEEKKTELAAIEQGISEEKQKDLDFAKQEAAIQKVEKQVGNIQRLVEESLTAVRTELNFLEIDSDTLLSLKVDLDSLNKKRDEISASRKKIKEELDNNIGDSLAKKSEDILKDIAGLSAKLSEPEKRYQAYLEAIDVWQKRKVEIVGGVDIPGTVKYFQDQRKKVEGEYPKRLDVLNRQRLRLSLEIYREKQQLRSHYARYYGSVQEYLDSYPIQSIKDFRIKFDVSISQWGFSDQFLTKVNQGKVGSFYGADEGAQKVSDLLDATNFDSIYGASRFLRKITHALHNHNSKKQDVGSQLKKGMSVEDVYNTIYSLEYLNPVYNLKWDGKELDQLSPGERGNLLLIFYLILDQNDVPLVIDQPEENLDNQTVFNTLVPCVKDAKKRRQIVLVTHNPNLAVVCDADQVVHAKIHKSAGNEVVYLSGSIENPGMNKKIIDVLEGTRPAFDKRDSKYWEFI